MIYIEIKFKNGSKLENIESEDSKRSYPTRIKFEEWETTTQPSREEIDRNRILYYQKHPEEFLELMGHYFHLKEDIRSRENIGQVGGNWMAMKL